jgi:DNA end-binding protein Ku
MTGEFDAEDYTDDYRQALMDVIEKKVAGEKPEPQERAAPTNITDLMAALEASVAAARSDRTATTADPPKRATRKKAVSAKAASAKAASAKAADSSEEPRQRRRKTA